VDTLLPAARVALAAAQQPVMSERQQPKIVVVDQGDIGSPVGRALAAAGQLSAVGGGGGDAQRRRLYEAAQADEGDGWQVVCPDGVRRRPPCRNLGDAGSQAFFASDPTWVARGGGCLPPCPGGRHTVRPAKPWRRVERGQA